VTSGRSVILADFEYLDLGPILKINFLEYFVTIKEQVHSELVQFFYSNLSIRSRVKNIDINVSLKGFARILKLSCEGEEIFHLDLHDFVYLDGENALTVSRFL